jgi:hypothetical protein
MVCPCLVTVKRLPADPPGQRDTTTAVGIVAPDSDIRVLFIFLNVPSATIKLNNTDTSLVSHLALYGRYVSPERFRSRLLTAL